VETRTAGSASGLGKRTGSNPDTAPQVDSTIRLRGLGVAGTDAAGRPARDTWESQPSSIDVGANVTLRIQPYIPRIEPRLASTIRA
jgi:hypothetical protein